MRIITDHKLTGLNEAIRLLAADRPGPGGANHCYVMEIAPGIESANPTSPRLEINFQNGPIGEAGINGISNEALLAVLIDRLRGFQHGRIYPKDALADNPAASPDLGFDFASRGKYACRENAIALTHLEDALMWLQKRTRDRMARGVEGTNKV